MDEDLGIEDRYAVRAPMQWSADGGFSTAAKLRRPMVSGPFGPERVNVAAQRREPDSLLNWFERLIRRRRECPELGFGDMTILRNVEADTVFAHRCDWDGATIVTIHELAGKPASVTLPIEEGAALVDLFGHDQHELPATLDLDPFAHHWFRVRRAGVTLPP